MTTQLNREQSEAIYHPAQAVRVIAGAGSGKTLVLVSRIRHLIESNVQPFHLLALTFTNKAAQEIKDRLQSALSRDLLSHHDLSQLWAGTFHSICHRILRRFAQRAGIIEQFTIIDNDEQLSIIKRQLKAREIDPKIIEPKHVQNYINQMKSQALRAAHVSPSDYHDRLNHQLIYSDYEHFCRTQGLVDFTELLLLTIELLEREPEVRALYQKRFAHILVDEFQDTSPLEFRFLQNLIDPEKTHLFVVGDDDQSIYGFRGAEVQNILQLQHHFPKLVTLRLEQNYRSTQTILNAANALIANNQHRLGKHLRSDKAIGEKIAIYPAANEHDEVDYVLKQIQQRHHYGVPYQHQAILYRINAYSRLFEQALTRHGIPYRIYGGHRFFERAEIKSALAYLRLMTYPHDNQALLRVINLPARGIGEKTQTTLQHAANAQNISLWQLISDPTFLTTLFSGKTLKALLSFQALIAALHAELPNLERLDQALYQAVHRSGLYEMYQRDPSEDAQTRLANLEQLIVVGIDGQHQEGTLAEQVMYLLSEASLASSHDDSEQNGVQLMTLHSAKGLEFPYVYMVGMEEGVFPNARMRLSRKDLEEERRLAYVGITRAQSALSLSCAQVRSVYGHQDKYTPSRFLYELPKALCMELRPLPLLPMALRHQVNHGSTESPSFQQHSTRGASNHQPRPPAPKQPSENRVLKIGQTIFHPEHGVGTLESMEFGDGGKILLTVVFGNGTTLTYPA